MPTVCSFHKKPIWLHDSCLFYLVAKNQAEGSSEIYTESNRGIETNVWVEGGVVNWTREYSFACLNSKSALKFWEPYTRLYIQTENGFNFPEIGISAVIVTKRSSSRYDCNSYLYCIYNNAIYFRVKSYFNNYKEHFLYSSPYVTSEWYITDREPSNYVNIDVIHIKYIDNGYDIYYRKYLCKSAVSFYKRINDYRSPSSDWPLTFCIYSGECSSRFIHYVGAVMLFEGDIYSTIGYSLPNSLNINTPLY